jgi:chromosome segregation ATPase
VNEDPDYLEVEERMEAGEEDGERLVHAICVYRAARIAATFAAEKTSEITALSTELREAREFARDKAAWYASILAQVEAQRDEALADLAQVRNEYETALAVNAFLEADVFRVREERDTWTVRASETHDELVEARSALTNQLADLVWMREFTHETRGRALRLLVDASIERVTAALGSKGAWPATPAP